MTDITTELTILIDIATLIVIVLIYREIIKIKNSEKIGEIKWNH